MRILRVTGMVFAVLGVVGCVSFASPSKAQRKAQKEAEQLATAAESACRTAVASVIVSYIKEAIVEFEDTAARAEQKDPEVWRRADPIRGRARPEIRRDCPGQMKAALAAAEQQEADQRAAHKQATAKKQARKAELRARLKGDRLRIFDGHGAPFRHDGALESAVTWRYGISIGSGADEVDCSVTYTFRGDRIAKKEIARFCPNDPHPGLAAR